MCFCASVSFSVGTLFLWSHRQSVDGLALSNEQIGGLTQDDNENQHCRKETGSAKTVVEIFSTLLLRLQITQAGIFMDCELSWAS